MKAEVRYTREVHAAHCPFTGKPLHDLEVWDCVMPFNGARPDAVPANADRDYGYLDKQGRQHTVFRRRAPATEKPCP